MWKDRYVKVPQTFLDKFDPIISPQIMRQSPHKIINQSFYATQENIDPVAGSGSLVITEKARPLYSNLTSFVDASRRPINTTAHVSFFLLRILPLRPKGLFQTLMAQEIMDQTLEAIESCRSPPDSSTPSPSPSLSRALSSSRLNARAAEFVPRGAQPPAAAPAPAPAPIHHGHAPAAHPVMHVFHQPQPISAYFGPGPGSFEYYGGGAAGGFGEHEGGGQSSVDPDPSYTARDGLSDEVVQKIIKQVCAFFTQIATLIS